MQQGSLFKNADMGKRERMIPAGTVLAEMRRINRRMGSLQSDLRALERMIVEEHEASRPRRHHSFEPAALAWLQELYAENPGLKSYELIKRFREEAAARGWRTGSNKSLYRVLQDLRAGARLLIPEHMERK